jgi:hypothetical protein
MLSNPSLIRGVGFGVACGLSLLAAIHFINLTMDDAFISFRYSENLAAGQGLVFNSGERVEGYTNFLWTVLMAVPAWLGAGKHDLGMLLIGKLLSLAFSLGSLAVVCWDPPPTAGRRLAQIPVGALFLATAASALVWSVGALEGPMVGFLIALSVRFWTVEMAAVAERKVLYGSALLLALAAMTRPEPTILIGPMFALRLFLLRRNLRTTWRHQVRYLLSFAVPVGLFLLWRWSYYGSLVPNTYYAKIYGDEGTLERGTNYLSEALTQMNLVPILGVACLCALLARGERRRVVLLIGLCSVQLAGIAYEGGDWMPAARLVVPTLPLIALLINSAWRGAINFELGQLRLPQLPSWVMPDEMRAQYNRWLDARMARAGARWSAGGAGLLGVALTLVIAGGAQKTYQTWAGRAGSGFSRIQMDSGLHFEVAHWMNRHIHDTALLATGEIGVVPYYTKLPVLDMFGLTDVHLARRKGSYHSKFDLQYVLDRAPKYVYFLMHPAAPGKKRRPQQNHARVLLESSEFQERYGVLQDFGLGILYQRRP